MKKNFKKASMLLVVTLILGLVMVLPSCGKAANPETDLSVELFDRDIPGLDMVNSFQSKFITEGVKEARNINVTFVTVPRWSDVEKLNILMAAGDAPDLCFLYDSGTIANYIKSGGLTDLGPSLDKYGQNLKKYLGEEVLRAGIKNGVQYTIPAKRPSTPAFSGFVRKDWLDKVGLDIPTTRDEFYEMLKTFKKENPGKVDNLIPFAIALDENNIDWTSHTLVWSFVEDMTDEQFASMYDQGRWIMPGYKEGIRYLNKLYNEGLLYQEFYLDDTNEQFEKEIIQGNVGSFIHNFDMPYRQSPGWLAELRKTVPDADIEPMDPFENAKGKHVKMRYSPIGLHMMVPIFHKDKADAAVKYLDWMASDPSIVKTLQNGELGKQYKAETADGIPIEKISNDDLPNDLKIQWHDFSIITTGSFEYGNDEINAKAQAMSYPGFEKQIQKAIDIAYTDSFLAPNFEVVIESEAKYTPNLKAKGVEIFVKSITADPKDFDKVYDDLVAEYMTMGAQEIIDEKLAAYKAAEAAKK